MAEILPMGADLFWNDPLFLPTLIIDNTCIVTSTF
jgi:hypothetical protein